MLVGKYYGVGAISSIAIGLATGVVVHHAMGIDRESIHESWDAPVRRPLISLEEKFLTRN